MPKTIKAQPVMTCRECGKAGPGRNGFCDGGECKARFDTRSSRFKGEVEGAVLTMCRECGKPLKGDKEAGKKFCRSGDCKATWDARLKRAKRQAEREAAEAAVVERKEFYDARRAAVRAVAEAKGTSVRQLLMKHQISQEYHYWLCREGFQEKRVFKAKNSRAKLEAAGLVDAYKIGVAPREDDHAEADAEQAQAEQQGRAQDPDPLHGRDRLWRRNRFRRSL